MLRVVVCFVLCLRCFVPAMCCCVLMFGVVGDCCVLFVAV